MAIQFVSAASIAGATLTLPSHSEGDLLILFYYKGSNTVAAVPAGWFTLYNVQSNGTVFGIAYRYATVSPVANPTWSGATILAAAVYRSSIGGTITIGLERHGPLSSTDTLTMPYALTPRVADSSVERVVAFGAINNNLTDIEIAPPGLVTRTSETGSLGESAIFDTDTATVWANITHTLTGTAGRVRTHVLELHEIATSGSAPRPRITSPQLFGGLG
jgi:hypothetical protein